ncbi:SH3 domain-containing protein [Vibrio fluvialis]
MKYLLSLLVLFVPTIVLASEKSMYVVASELNVRLQPNDKGKITNVLYYGQKVDVFEFRSGWARISKYYDGSIEGVSGNVARWVSSKYLNDKKPTPKTQKGMGTTRLEKALSHSDDYSAYKSIFINKSQVLINMGRCSLSDFEESGGWIRSTNYKPKKVYFTYCGKAHVSNRIYLDISSQKLFQ